MNLNDLKARREEILHMAERHGARNVRLFGSILHETAAPESDVDLLVEMEEGRSLLDRISLAQDLEDLLGRRVDLVTERTLYWRLRERILAEAEPL